MKYERRNSFSKAISIEITNIRIALYRLALFWLLPTSFASLGTRSKREGIGFMGSYSHIDRVGILPGNFR